MNTAADTTPDTAVPPLFQPFTLRRVTFPNRIIVSPMCQYCADDGFANEWHFAHHGRFALGGVGGAVVEASGVTREGRITPGCLGIYLDAHIPGLRRIVDIYRAQGVPVGIQLAHAGRKASAAVPLEGAQPFPVDDPQAWQAVAPSAIPLTEDWPVPHALSADEIEQHIDAFARAAERAVEAGFDFVEIHGAHGYLIHSFLTALSNRREDEWGGSLEKRMRFAIRIAEAIRAVVPADMPVLYRATSVDGVEGGMTIEDTIELAKALKAAGVDLIDCSSGGITGSSGRSTAPPSPGYLVPFAKAIREKAGIPTMAVGLIVTGPQANQIVAEGSADLVALARELIANPNFAYHAALELGHPEPHDVLPAAYAFFLKRRKL